MTVGVLDGIIRLTGVCPVEEAETLLAALADGAHAVDLSGATRLHFALVQVLAIAGTSIEDPPDDPFLRDVVLPALRHLG